MSIVENEVSVGLNHMNIEYYESLGYDIPRRKDKQGRMTIARGTKILVDIGHLQDGSEVLVSRKCDICGKIDEKLVYNSLLKVRMKGDGKDRCYICTRNKAWTKRKKDIPYEKSLEYFAKENSMSYLIEEYSKKNHENASAVFKSSGKLFWWECLVCGSEYEMNVNERTDGAGCPYCRRRRVNKTNCLSTTHPEIATILVDTKLGDNITSGLHSSVEVRCPDCKEIFPKPISVLARKGFSCPRCGDNISYPEKIMIDILSQLSLKFSSQKKFKWSRNKRYDFYLPDHNMIIETHGKQHYEDTFTYYGGRSAKEEQENDLLKENIAKDNGISTYITVDCRKSEIGYIKESVIKSLHNHFNIKDVDWDRSNAFAQKSLVKEACSLWGGEIKSTKDIGEVLNISQPTVLNYLRKGREFGWCDYDSTIVQKENGRLTGLQKGKRVIQYTLDNKYIKTWDSVTLAGKSINLSNRHITRACIGEVETLEGYKWSFEEQVNIK